MDRNYIGPGRLGCDFTTTFAFTDIRSLPCCHAAGTSFALGLIRITDMTQFFAVPVLMIIGRIAYFRSDMTCVIGLKAFSYVCDLKRA